MKKLSKTAVTADGHKHAEIERFSTLNERISTL